MSLRTGISTARSGLAGLSAATLTLTGVSVAMASPAGAAACTATPTDLGGGVYEVTFTGDCEWTAPTGLDTLEALLVGAGGTSLYGYAGGGGEVKVVSLDATKTSWTVQVGDAAATDGDADTGRDSLIANGATSLGAVGGHDGDYVSGGASGNGNLGGLYAFGGPGGGAGGAAASTADTSANGGAGLTAAAAAGTAGVSTGLFGSDTRCFGGGGATSTLDQSASPWTPINGVPGCGGGYATVVNTYDLKGDSDPSNDVNDPSYSDVNATANSGGGGGGAGGAETQGAAADGVVILRYTLGSEPDCDLSGISTLSQGGWSNTSTSSPLTSTWFTAQFSGGLTIGGAGNSVRLTGADKVRRFLPQSGTPAVLKGGAKSDLTNKELKNTLAGQVTALTLNLALNPDLADKELATGYAGTVAQLLTEANAALNNTGSPSKSVLANLSILAEYVNLSFPAGVDQGRIACANES